MGKKNRLKRSKALKHTVAPKKGGRPLPWDIACGAIAFLLPCIFILRHPGNLFGSDVVLTFIYQKAYVGRILAEGDLPLWDPHSMCGYPLMAAMQAGVFYPGTWIFCLLAPWLAWTWTVALHLGLAGLFSWLWLRRGIRTSACGALGGALVYGLSGFIMNHLYGGHVSLICAYPWIPCVLWRLERLLREKSRCRIALLAISFSLLILPGYPMFVFFTAIVLLARLAYWLFNQGVSKQHGQQAVMVGIALLAGILIASPQLYPSMELLSQTQRLGGTDFDFASSFSFPPENTIAFFSSGFFGYGTAASPYWGRWISWEVLGFFSISAPLLAALGLYKKEKGRWFWCILSFAALILAMAAIPQYMNSFRMCFSPQTSFVLRDDISCFLCSACSL